jgi:metallophosphoesterase (TIGR00282 family)
MPEEAPGSGHTIVKAEDGTEVGVINVQGRTFMSPTDCPFRAAKRSLKDLSERVRVIIVDMHAEATSDKIAMGRFLDGRVTAVLGTHTHVQTADEQIFPGGTAYITDVGMVGPYESVLGRRVESVVSFFSTQLPTRFEVASEDVRMGGALVEADPATGRALAIERVMKSDETA